MFIFMQKRYLLKNNVVFFSFWTTAMPILEYKLTFSFGKKNEICIPKIIDFTLTYLQMYAHDNYRKIVSCEIRTNNFVNFI